MTSPERFEQHLQQQYQQDKAQHPLPRSVKRRIVAASADNRRVPLQQLWRYTQVALSCGALLVLGYVMQQSTPAPSYQIIVSSGQGYQQVQQHSLANATAPSSSIQLNSTDYAQAQQFYAQAQQQTNQFHTQTGMLKQQQQQWQITVCDQLQLNIDTQLIAQLGVKHDQLLHTQQAQWVDFISTDSGQILAIQPAKAPLHCPQS